jgi:crotonobetainyl-CoA:carnitine CoA-transferase CaiB-like acyl-CoA transferase
MHSGYPLGDAVGGLFGALAVMSALWPRARNPDQPGEEIDLSLTEGILKVLDFLPIEYEQLGVVRARSGNANQYSAPSLVCKSADGRWFSLAGSTDALFARNCRAIGQPGLISDPRFRDNAARVQHASTLNDIFRGWCATQTAAQVTQAFQAAGGTIAPVYDAADIAADPQFAARGAVVDVPDHDFGSVKMPAVVPRFANAPTALRHSARDMAHDNDEVFGEWLGLTPDERECLRSEGVI